MTFWKGVYATIALNGASILPYYPDTVLDETDTSQDGLHF